MAPKSIDAWWSLCCGFLVCGPVGKLHCFLLTQADEGPKALNFWLKQRLSEGAAAKTALEFVHEADPKKNVWYDHSTPMLCEINDQTCAPNCALAQLSLYCSLQQ